MLALLYFFELAFLFGPEHRQVQPGHANSPNKALEGGEYVIEGENEDYCEGEGLDIAALGKGNKEGDPPGNRDHDYYRDCIEGEVDESHPPDTGAVALRRLGDVLLY